MKDIAWNQVALEQTYKLKRLLIQVDSAKSHDEYGLNQLNHKLED